MQDNPRTATGHHSGRYLRRAEAANYVEATYGFPCSRQWLAKLAVVGGGPIYRKAGRTPIYAPADLDTWALSRIGAPRRSTSDDPSSMFAQRAGAEAVVEVSDDR